MSFFGRFFGKPRRSHRPVSLQLDEGFLTSRITEAKRLNEDVVSSFVETTQKQVSDAKFARQVIRDVLQRADNLKALHHAGNKK